MVDSPPKVITKVQAITGKMPEKEEEISIQPFVISTRPARMEESSFGISDRRGLKDCIITKNNAMIAPTDKTERQVSITI